jgi:hypothetical protein
LELTDACGGCSVDGTCTVRLEPRLTDDLPPGGELFVESRQYSESCTDCVPVCATVRRLCEVPPLVVGDFYRVNVLGAPALTFVAGDGTTVWCNGTRSTD